jgi:hypothetical protein
VVRNRGLDFFAEIEISARNEPLIIHFILTCIKMGGGESHTHQRLGENWKSLKKTKKQMFK